ncbi:unnamed protein product, partial [Mesorhabditis belari]|uniref:Uncharacterized protein n=1 Tax=Mesorhabditis belari TaxID=2138241 RepID=A0AAF3EKL1_9BILA
MGAYENEYEIESDYEKNSFANIMSFQSKKPPVMPSTRVPCKCRLTETSWAKNRRKHKAFIMIFSTLFIVVDAVFWSLIHLTSNESPLKELFSKGLFDALHAIFGTAIFLTYIVFCLIGLYGILFKRKAFLLTFIIYLFIVVLTCLPHIIYHITVKSDTKLLMSSFNLEFNATNLLENSFALRVFNYFHPQILPMLDQDCPSMSTELSVRNLRLGLFYFSIGLSYPAPYALCLIGMWKGGLMKILCYRILFLMGIVDILSAFPNSLVPGYLLITGDSVCTSPIVNLYGGGLSFFLWSIYCCLSIVLAVNRCVDSLLPQWQQAFFGGFRLWLWAGISSTIALLSLLSKNDFTFIWNNEMAAYFLDIDPNKSVEIPFLHFMSNVVGSSIITVLNMVMLFSMFRTAIKSEVGVSHVQKVIFIQCLLICSSVMLSSWLYASLQFFTLPPIFGFLAMIAWQFANGGPVLFYLIVNRTIRNEVKQIISCHGNQRRVYATNSNTANEVDLRKNSPN